jgi:hypothetical protein
MLAVTRRLIPASTRAFHSSIQAAAAQSTPSAAGPGGQPVRSADAAENAEVTTQSSKDISPSTPSEQIISADLVSGAPGTFYFHKI